MVIARLTFAQLSQRKSRLALTVLAIALSASLVVAVTTGFASIKAAVFQYFNQYLGATDIEIVREGDRGTINESLLDKLRADPEVASAVGRLELESPLLDRNGKPPTERPWMVATIVGARLPLDADIANLKMEAGKGGAWFSGSRGDVAVIDQVAAEMLKVALGDEVVVPAPNKQLRLKVVGIVHKPQIMAAAQQWIYVPLETLQEFAGAPRQVTRISITLRNSSRQEAFKQRWQIRLDMIDPRLQARAGRHAQKEAEKDMNSVEFLSYLGGTVSMLAATFIVFATLSMGVIERQRSLAMLRAVGATKRQIGAMVMLEGVIFAILGVVAGIPLGLLWVKILATWKAKLFVAGIVPSAGGIIFAAGGSIITALVASAIPAFNAMRTSPIEGLSAPGHHRRNSLLWPTVAGLLLIAVDPVLVHSGAFSRSFLIFAHFGIGLPCLMLGFFLLAPLFIWTIEKSLGRLVAGMLGVKQALLAQQLSGAMWRSAGTVAALMVGLATLVVMQTHGNSILNGWRLPDRFPDIFIFVPLGIDQAGVEKLQTVDGIRKDEVLPIAIDTPALASSFLSVPGTSLIPDRTMFIAIDPEKAMKMMDLEFREGNAADAVRMLKQGRHVIVTEELRQLKGLHVGGTLKLKTPLHGDVDYKVAGVIWSPGMDVFVAMFDMRRQFQQRSAASVFGTIDDYRRDFGKPSFRLIAANLNGSIERPLLESRARAKLSAWGMMTGDVRHIKAEIVGGFRKLVALLSLVALAAIVVAALGVTNTIMASIRARRWQLGILRSVGLTRGQMLRLILGEVILLAIVGCALGVVAGLEMSFNALGFSGRIIGYSPPLDVPWRIVALGSLLTGGAAILASIAPAVSAARDEPLSLLTAGRAAA